MGIDIGASIAASSTANSGARVNAANTINAGGGGKIPTWFLFGGLAAALLIGIAYIFHR